MARDDKPLLLAAVRRGWITQAQARDLRADEASATTALVARGWCSQEQVADLLREQDAALPATFGHYRVRKQLGRGGMGVVYLAEQTSLGRRVALKVLTPDCTHNERLVARFQREARLMASLAHANVVTCYDVGEAEGRLFMAMEYVGGGDVDQLARKHGGRLDDERVIAIAAGACRGLNALATQGLIHRDLKPSNIFIGAAGEAKLADFGLARDLINHEGLTMPGKALGTPSFMSPEQARGEPDLDTRCDIYGLGATMYQLVTGSPPYRGSSPMQTMQQVVRAPVPDPRALAPTCSPALAAVIMTCLAKDRQERYADPDALLAALEAARQQPQRRPPGPRPVRRRPAAASPTPRSVDRRARRSRGAGNGPLIALVVGLAVVLIGLVVWLVLKGPQ